MRKDIEILVYPTRIIKRETKDPFGDDCAAIVCTCYISRMEIYKNFRNRLVMGFDSIEDKTHINAFKPEHAEMIKTFVDNLDPRIKKLYILTDRGISRGQAIKAALVLYQFGKNSDLYIWRNPEYDPNTLVFKLLCRSFGIRFADIKTRIRKRIKIHSLHKAVTKNNRNVRS